MSNLKTLFGAAALLVAGMGVAHAAADTTQFNIGQAEALVWEDTGVDAVFNDVDYGTTDGTYYEEWTFTIPEGYGETVALAFDSSVMDFDWTSNVEFYLSDDGSNWTAFTSPTTFELEVGTTYYIGGYFEYSADDAGQFSDGVAVYGSIAPVPEAETYAMMGVGALGLLLARRRKTLRK